MRKSKKTSCKEQRGTKTRKAAAKYIERLISINHSNSHVVSTVHIQNVVHI